MKKEAWKEKMFDIETNFGTNASEFKHYVGREPKNKDEILDWTHYVKKGMESQLDWEIINKCASENFK